MIDDNIGLFIDIINNSREDSVITGENEPLMPNATGFVLEFSEYKIKYSFSGN